MQNRERCQPCTGSGRVMGGGMIIKDCLECSGKGYIIVPDNELDFLAAKQTESFIAAKNRLMKKQKGLTEEEADKLLEKALKDETQSSRKN